MVLLFILTLVLLPFIEIYAILRIADVIGGWSTFFLLFFSGIAGVALARTQKHRVFHHVQQSLMRGQAPAQSMVEGLLIFIGGVLLILPGFVTDILGLIIILPVLRPLLAARILKSLERRAQMGTVRFFSMGGTGAGFQSQHHWGFDERAGPDHARDVIDVSAEKLREPQLPTSSDDKSDSPEQH